MALINRQAIPSDWASTPGWTRSYTSGAQGKGCKRPLIRPSDVDSAPTLYDLLDSENPANPIGYCGFISSRKNQYAVIDIDAPKVVKEYLKSKIAYESPSSEEVSHLVEQKVLEPCPAAIRKLVKETYSEYSASGLGIHIVIKTDKTNLPKRAYWKAKDFEGQLSISNNYMVTTGNRVQGSPDEIKEVPATLLTILFGIDTSQTSQSGERDGNTIIDAETLPSPTEMETALMLIPLDQSPRIKEVYKQVTGEEYQHYDFWLRVGMSLHDYATKAKQLTNGLSMYIKWSIQDKAAFVSDEDVASKWRSFGNLAASYDNDEDRKLITYKTIFKLSLAFQFNYPRRIHTKDGTPLLNPERTEYVNFEYLMNKYHIKLHIANGLELYVTGDEDIIQKYFKLHDVHSMFGYYGPYDKAMLEAATWQLCQDSMWRGLTGTKNFVATWTAKEKPEVDMFYLWLTQDDDSLPDEYKYPRFVSSHPRPIKEVPATFEFVESCIQWESYQDVELCKKMLYKLFMQMIKLHEPSFMAFEDNGGMFALIGPENTYKTTFFKLLLPYPLEFLRQDINQELNSEKAKRDFLRSLSTRAIVLVDEFEGFMDQKKSGSFFKAIISGNTTSFVDIYQTKEQALKRKAVIVGTSNDARQIISDNGSRRLWFARIKSINTSALLNLNLHKFYQNMRAEFIEQINRGISPWSLSMAESQQVTNQNAGLKAQSSIDIALNDAFPYTTDYNIQKKEDLERLVPSLSIHDLMPTDSDEQCRFMKTTHVAKLLRFKQVHVPPHAELERALERFCMAFLGQTKTININSNAAVERGRLCLHRRLSGTWNHKFWILPIEEDYNVD